jgi:predicted nucleic acid-binding protein
VFDVIATSPLTAYDVEFVALASGLDVPLVTADKAVLKAFPHRACTMQAFLAGVTA